MRRRWRRPIGASAAGSGSRTPLEAAWANGYTGHNFRDARSVLRYAFRPDLEAGSQRSTSAGSSPTSQQVPLGGFLFGRADLAEYLHDPQRLGFQDRDQLPADRNDQYEQVARAERSSTGRWANESYTNKADTYGLMLTIDRRDIINDDLGRSPQSQGSSGELGLKIKDTWQGTYRAGMAIEDADPSSVPPP